MAQYSNNSPWYNTPMKADYLDILSIRPVSAEPDDILYAIDAKFEHRPDLLAYALYGDPGLWWVFAQRNLDVIQDPIFDFKAGTKIYLPKGSSLKTVLGI